MSSLRTHEDATGRTALVTGGAIRVGRQITRRLHELGYNLIIHCHSSRDPAEALAAELNKKRRDSAEVQPFDLAEEEGFQAFCDACLARYQGLDLLVNNASTFYPTPLKKITRNDWNDLMATNLRAPLFLSQIFAEALAATRGSIVNIVDIHADQPLRGHLVYSVAKAGLKALTLGLAKELAPEVRVNGVSPGPVLWPSTGANAINEIDASTRQKIIDSVPLGRVGEPADVAEMVAFLALSAPYVTGQVIAVDGGRSIR